MSIKDKYHVLPIDKKETYPWLNKKHYAKRIPSISYSFGLYNKSKVLKGVCTFGSPCYEMENGNCVFKDFNVKTVELNRLIKNDDLEKNVTSYFVSCCIKLLPKPICIVSYADPNNGHMGYIYQATNFSLLELVRLSRIGSTKQIRKEYMIEVCLIIKN